MKLKIITFLAFCAITIGIYWFSSTYEEIKHDQSQNLIVQEKLEKSKAFPILEEVNTRNEKIKDFACDNLHVVAQMPNKRPVKLNGNVYYEKEKKFRLQLDSILGSELDVGSDGNSFWFWSRRLKEPGLYWAYHKDFNKTKLKTPFNPFWLSNCLGIDKIDYKNAIIDSGGSRWRVINNTVNAHNEPVTVVIYVNPQTKLITGHGMYDTSNKLVASTEIQSFDNGLPSKMTFMWHKENASMIWTLKGVGINVGIDSSKWSMPNKTPKFDMSRE
jgi:hypothetical protein